MIKNFNYKVTEGVRLERYGKAIFVYGMKFILNLVFKFCLLKYLTHAHFPFRKFCIYLFLIIIKSEILNL